jgi:hypothetical protein
MVVPYGPKLAVFVEKGSMDGSRNNMVLKNELSSSNPKGFGHRGPQEAEGGHHEEVGLGLAELRSIAFFV